INEVLPVLSTSGSLPLHAAEIQISILSSSFPIALNCQLKSLFSMISIFVSVIGGVAIRSKKSINESIVFIPLIPLVRSDTHHKMRVCLADLRQSKHVSAALWFKDQRSIRVGRAFATS